MVIPVSFSLKNIKENYCLVCLENEPEVIWMPCGHMSVCSECCRKMFNKKNACCVLCKLLPLEVYVIQSEDNGKSENNLERK